MRWVHEVVSRMMVGPRSRVASDAQLSERMLFPDEAACEVGSGCKCIGCRVASHRCAALGASLRQPMRCAHMPNGLAKQCPATRERRGAGMPPRSNNPASGCCEVRVRRAQAVFGMLHGAVLHFVMCVSGARAGCTCAE